MKFRVAFHSLALATALPFSAATSYFNSSYSVSSSEWIGTGSVLPSISSNIAVNATPTTNSSWGSVESCNAAWQKYTKNHISTSSWPAMVTDLNTYWTYFPPVNATPYTTLCDGTPRAHGTASWDYTTETQTFNYSSTMTITDSSAPTPTCGIASKDCAKLWYDWYHTSPYNASQPGCSSTCDPALLITDYKGDPNPPCTIVADSVQLAYWPVTVKNNLCGNGTTITGDAASLRTASIWGTTITSPGVIVSFHSLYAVDRCWGGRTANGYDLPNYPPMGEPLTDYLLLQQTSQVSTQCGAYHQGGGVGKQINFADFNSPVPASAYSCQVECGNGDGGVPNMCTTIYDNFNPQIAFPTDVFNIKPEWKSCTIEFMGNVIHDPPLALSEYGAPTTPTVANPAPTTPAQPGNPAPTTVQPTKAPQNDDPGSPDGSDDSPSNNSPGNSSPSDDSPSNNDDSPHDTTPGNSNPSGNNNSPGGSDPPGDNSNADSDEPSNSDLEDGNPAGNIVSLLNGGNPDYKGPSNHDPEGGDPVGTIVSLLNDVSLQTDNDTSDPYGNNDRGSDDPETTELRNNGVSDSDSDPAQDSDAGTDSDSADSGSNDPEAVEGAILTINGETYTATELPNGNIVIDGTTLSADGPAFTMDGTTIKDGKKGIIVDGKTTSVSKLDSKATSSTTGDGTAKATGTKDSGAGRSSEALMVTSLFVGLVMMAMHVL